MTKGWSPKGNRPFFVTDTLRRNNMSQIHYKITNTTRQPGVRKGPHKNGFFVSVIRGKPMGPGRHVIVEKVTPGMLAMQRKGFVSISQVDDINLEVKKEFDFVEKQNEARREAQKTLLSAATAQKALAVKEQVAAEQRLADSLKTESVVESSFDKTEMKEMLKESNGNVMKAIISGEGAEFGEDPLSDVEDAISPDGEPNFVVTAGKKKNKNKNRN